MSKGTFVGASFMFVTIFLYIYENRRRKTLLTFPVPSILKYLIEIKNDVNVYFHVSLWCLKTKKKCENKRFASFSPFIPHWENKC